MEVAAYEEIGAETSERVQQATGIAGTTERPVAAFVAPAGEGVLFHQIQNTDSDFVVYHKQFPGLKTPFDLPIECFPDYEAMLDEDPTCVDTVNVMLRGAVAKSTASNYKSVINRFHAFSMERGQESGGL